MATPKAGGSALSESKVALLSLSVGVISAKGVFDVNIELSLFDVMVCVMGECCPLLRQRWQFLKGPTANHLKGGLLLGPYLN